jgi:hypothetical protein
MIPKSFDLIGPDDLQTLIDNKVPESKTLEYKRDLPDNSDKAKHAFLAAVASLANTYGGDLLYGISAVDGIPVATLGVGTVIEDQLKLRLESMIRSGIEPRLPKLELRLISSPDGPVLLVRVTKSWAAPHRVTVRDSGPFYARHSSGKFELDVAELRAAFALSDSIIARIESFRDDRENKISGHSTPVPIPSGCKMILHIIPLSAFASREQLDMRHYGELLRQFHPLGRTQIQNSAINLEGVVDYANPNAQGRSHAYTQIFRSGIVEAVEVIASGQDEKHIHSRSYEHHAWNAVQRYLELLGQMEVSPPFYVFLSLTRLKGLTFLVPNNGFGHFARTPDRDAISLPAIVVADPTIPAYKLLRPAFDMIWNAFGYPESENYDADGNWIEKN